MTMTLLSLLGLAVGLVAGTLHFLTLRRVTALYLGGGSPARASSISSAIASLRRWGRACLWAREATTEASISPGDRGAPSMAKLASASPVTARRKISAR